METMAAMKARCSVKEFKDKKIPKELIEKIIDCTRLAPTAREEEGPEDVLRWERF